MALTRPRAAQIYDIDYKQATRVVTVANITLSGGAPSSVDGVSLSLDDRVLVTGQSTASQNGIYYVTTVGTGSNGTWARSTDTNSTGELLSGTIVMVTQGLVYADTQWKLTTDDPITIGSSSLNFVQNYLANSISAGTSNVVVASNANVTISSAGTPNVLTVSSTGVVVSGTGSVTGNITSGNLQTTGQISVTGNAYVGNILTNGYYYANGVAFSGGGGGTPGGANTYIQFNDNGTFNGTSGLTFNKTTNALATAGTFSATGNITASNLILSGAIMDSGQLDIQTTASNGNIVLTPNGTGNVNTGANISATGRITAASLVGGVITGTSLSVSGAVTGASLVGTLTTAAQTNITSVGTLGSLSVTANIQGGNLRTAGLISATGTVTGSSFSGAGTGLTGTAASLTVGAATTATTATSATTAGTVTTAAQPNITSVGTLTSVTSSGTISATGNITGGNLITSGSGGNITGANVISATTITTSQITNSGANGVGNIGSSTTYFNTVFAKATSAQYADLAEMYSADDNYASGTVVEFGGAQEITISTQSHSPAVAGIISTNPSYLMNSALDCVNALEVALTGRVPCQVVGTIRKGDRLVASQLPGVATALDMTYYQPGCIIGKALEEYNSIATGIIEVAVGRF